MNHYETLGVSKNATDKEIRAAFLSLIKQYHPDTYKGNQEYATKKTSEINVAYDILSKPELRKQYDEEITPKTYTTTSYSSPDYSYTPPEYDSPKYNREYYKEQYYKKYGNYNDAARRYTDYHRSKTPNSDYTYKNNFHDQFADNLSNSINKNVFSLKLQGFIIIFILYLGIMLFSINQITKMLNDNEAARSLIPTSTSSTSSTSSSSSSTSIDDSNNPYIYDEDKDINIEDASGYEDFDITDYIPETDLIQIYRAYYQDDFNSYEEFKNTISKYYYENYIEY